MPAWLFDGRSAMRHDVQVRIGGGSLTIGDGTVPIAGLFRVDDTRPIFGRRDVAGWRLGFDGPLPPPFASALPRAARYGGWIDRIGIWRAATAAALLSAILLVGALAGIDLIARAIPFSWERRFGDALTGDFGGAMCTGKAGQAALDGLALRLSPAGRPMRARVVDIDVVNAVALPGGRILIFRGLIDDARSPDEVAGVIAHEIGHVDKRHVMAALIRRFGLGLLLGSNGRPGEYAQVLFDSTYSRSAERAADAYSVAHLTSAGISPRGTADFFGRLARKDAKDGGRISTMLGYLSSHPPSDERRDLFLTAARAMPHPAPALDARSWQAVKAVCATTAQPAGANMPFRF